MKTLTEFIAKKHRKAYKLFTPQNRFELSEIIIDLLKDGVYNLNCIDVSDITDMRYLFTDIYQHLCKEVYNPAELIKNINVSDWDVSNVTNMENMFSGCTTFNSDLSKWDVSKVENMSYMFFLCHEFNADISSWDVSSVTNFVCTFKECSKFNQDLSNWKVSRCRDFRFMFDRCENFNQDLSSWDLGAATNIVYMFSKCKKLKQDFSSWDKYDVIRYKDKAFQSVARKCIKPRWA